MKGCFSTQPNTTTTNNNKTMLMRAMDEHGSHDHVAAALTDGLADYLPGGVQELEKLPVFCLFLFGSDFLLLGRIEGSMGWMVFVGCQRRISAAMQGRATGPRF
jgi:hypothetical protein